MVNISAVSGHWVDIQDAVDLASPGDNVFIPSGTFNFVNADEEMPARTVNAQVQVPAGINIFGATTERTSGLPYNGMGMNPNDQVVEHKTILVIPAYECAATVPGQSADYIPGWFAVKAPTPGDYSNYTRISDIRFEGYREIDINTPQMTIAIFFYHAGVYRVDHCDMKNVCGGAVSSIGYNRGVIDHCSLVNDAGIPSPYGARTVGYGIGHSILGTTVDPYPDPPWLPIEDVLGKYTPYTVFVEDCYSSKWRHLVTNGAGHLVFRHSTIQYDFGQGSLDSHEFARAMEVYNNNFIDRDDVGGPWTGRAHQIRGGGGVYTDNYVDASYSLFMSMSGDGGGPTQVWIKDNYIWDNTNLAGGFISCTGCGVGNEYEENEPGGFMYSPFTYPHPLIGDENGGDPKMEQATYDRLKVRLNGIRAQRAQWSEKSMFTALMAIMDEILDALEP